jgi:opacity protein-like surface antigen/outer membrane protein OmpA-like peptidoglycan-associated protein
MKTSGRMIAIAAVAVLLLPALTFRAEETAGPSTGAEENKAVDAGTSSASDPAAPMPADSSAAAMPYTNGANIGTPRVEIFLGYSYLRAVPTLAAGNRFVWLNGGSTSIAFNFNGYLGLVGDFGGYADSQLRLNGAATPAKVADSSGSAYTYLFGPRLSFRRHERITPFVQVLFGGVHASDLTISGCSGAGCTPLPSENDFAMTAGGGLDVRVHRHIAIRVIQAEYLMTRFQNLSTGSNATQNDVRLSAGIVFRFGGGAPAPPPVPLTYSCSVNPSSVFLGEVIAESGTALNLNPAKTAVYTWSVDGGTVSGTTSTANIETRTAVPGSYTLKGHVSEGDKPAENADCTAPYVVKANEPPTVSCTANPVTVTSGNPSTITAIGVSPQNRPLTYSYTSTTGSVSGSGATATLSTTGAAAGTIDITCNVIDDKGMTASATTSVMVVAPPVAVKPSTSALCAISFDRDSRRPSRVDNEGKACLDEIALTLKQDPDAKLAIIGNAGSHENGGNKLAAERAANTKAYLVKEKGFDSSRIAAYMGSQDGKTVSVTLIPAGATLDTTGDTPVN